MSLKFLKIEKIDKKDQFFNSLREDYNGFDNWLDKKGEEYAYVSVNQNNQIEAFLYLKIENGIVDDVVPQLPNMKRTKIGTFKVIPHGTLLGERLIKKIFDFSIEHKVDEIYVTIFAKHTKLVEILTRYGFNHYGKKGNEEVYLRKFRTITGDIFKDYPLFHRNSGNLFLLAIYPEYHTKLLPDSKLNNESENLIKDTSSSNSIEKVYLTSMKGVGALKNGDLLAIYRTSDYESEARYRSVVTSICTIVEVKVIYSFTSYDDFVSYCGKHTVFTKIELQKFWDEKKYKYIIKFLYNANLPKRVIRDDLLKYGIINADDYSGFIPLSIEGFKKILILGKLNAHFVVDKT